MKISQTFARRVLAPRRRAKDENAREGRRRFASSAFARARESTRATRRDVPEDALAYLNGGEYIDASLRWRRADDVRLVLARHAKSDWSDPNAEDWARGLRPRGRRRAKRLAMRLTDRWNAFEPDVVITSDAVRCSETLACMGEAREAFGNAPVARARDVYDDAHGAEGVVDAEACVETIGRRVVRHANENGARCVLCLGHNMGFEVAARYLTGRAAPLKTAHAAVLSARGAREGVDRAYLVLTAGKNDVARSAREEDAWVRRASETRCADARFSVGDVFVYAAVDDDAQTRDASDDPWSDAFRERTFRLDCVLDPDREFSIEERTRMEVERRLERLVVTRPRAALDEIIDQLLAQRDDMERTLETD